MSHRAEGRRRSGRHRGRPVAEPVETRILLSVFTVTDTADSGPESFRQAILDSNANPAPVGQSNQIDFKIAGPGPYTISPISALPAITATVAINSTTPQQLGELIELQGGLAGPNVDGLTIMMGKCVVISGLEIVQFSGSGIKIDGGSDDVVEGCDIGLDANDTALGNGVDGVTIDSSSGNTIGGTAKGAGNFIADSGGSGVDLDGCMFDSVQGNTIGLSTNGKLVSNKMNSDGTPQQIGNVQDGVLINGGGSNTIGGSVAGAGNIISGNLGDGISIVKDSSYNDIQENLVGLGLTGLSAPGNLVNGIYIAASNNYVGTNVVAGNLNRGIVLSTPSAKDNQVAANLIYGNREDGVFVDDGAMSNTIGGTTAFSRNLISGNGNNGVEILGSDNGDDTDQSTTGNFVLGNYIGTSITGTAQEGNAANGVLVDNATGNYVGMPGAGNLIAGNLNSGVAIQGEDAAGNMVLANQIGTIMANGAVLGNLSGGVTIIGGSGSGQVNTIQGNSIQGNVGTGVSIRSESIGTMVKQNVISKNSSDGVSIASNSQGVGVVGNLIGVDPTGESAMGNKLDGVRVSNSEGTMLSQNVISANDGDGIDVVGTSSNTTIQGNAIGLDLTGTKALSNPVGVLVDGVSDMTIGGTVAGAGNLISGNGIGIEVVPGADPSAALGDLIAGNAVGLDIRGRSAVGNQAGIFLDDVVGVTVGGTTPFARNEISGNTSFGVEVFRIASGTLGNLIEGNTIGLDASGETVPAGADQAIGVFLDSASYNTIGGTTPGAGNVISGNLTTAAGATSDGVLISGESDGLPLHNLVEGNNIGTDINGLSIKSASAQQGVGVAINASSGNTIGATTSGAIGNLIEGNVVGVLVAGQVEAMPGNTIGGDTIDSNTYGVFINGASANTLNNGDQISLNTLIGLSIVGASAQNNTVTGDAISGNGSSASGASNANAVGDGIYIESATDNSIVGNAISSSGLIEDDKQRDGVGIYLFDNATGNQVEKNTISGSSAYGIFLFNSAGNLDQVSLNGKQANTISKSGIAEFREFTGSVSTSNTSSTVSAAATPKGPKHKRKK